MIKCAVIGVGYWGPNIVRNIASSSATRIVAICDSNTAKSAQMAQQYRVSLLTSDPQEVFASPDVDAVFIATPVMSHYELALAALRAGKHVFVEKPLATTAAHAEHLVEEAEKRNLRLMVDHVFVYNPAVKKMRELVADGTIGNVLYYDSVRVNLGLFQHDVNVIWDLVVHDLSIVDYILDEKPTTILTQARAHVKGQPENMAYISCAYDSGIIAHFHVNWLAPVKIRRTLVGGTRQMIVYDDLEPDEKLKVYDRGLDITAPSSDNAGLQFGYRLGDMSAPMLGRTEALRNAIEHFAKCVNEGTAATTDGRCGLRVVRMLEAANRSAEQDGRAVRIEY